MNKPFLIICFTLLMAFRTQGRDSTDFYVTLADTSIISQITPAGIPVFTIAGINDLCSLYNITGFWKAYPDSRFPDVRKIYRLKVERKTSTPPSLSYLPEELKIRYPDYFPYYELAEGGGEVTHTPTVEMSMASFGIYPNPTTDRLNVSYSYGGEVSVDISILDITGCSIMSNPQQHFDSSPIKVDVSSLTPGVYLLQLIRKNEISQRFKFTKQ